MVRDHDPRAAFFSAKDHSMSDHRGHAATRDRCPQCMFIFKL
jgi:hypothetical protein